jgi:hypothetical protein
LIFILIVIGFGESVFERNLNFLLIYYSLKRPRDSTWYFISFIINIIRTLNAFAGVSHGVAGESKLAEPSHRTSHEGVTFSNVNFILVVDIELNQGSWEELGHVGFHFGFNDLFGNE